jgi:DNA-binding MarR family transcriptional regulator
MVVAQLGRRLRAEQRFPLSHGLALGRLEREGPLTTSGLAASENVKPQSMAQTLADLEAGGLVTRSPDPNDRRQTLIGITPLGEEVLERERLRQGGWLADAIRAQLDPEEQELLARAATLLRRLVDA